VWQPLKRNGKPVFLRPDEVKGTNLGGILDGHYRGKDVRLQADSNVLALYADACGMAYSLLLDITVSRVNVEGASLRDKAQWLAGHFGNLTVITIDGLLIRYKLPQQDWHAESWAVGLRRREKTFEDLLNELEPKMQGAPVAVFGYSQMIRGDRLLYVCLKCLLLYVCLVCLLIYVCLICLLLYVCLICLIRDAPTVSGATGGCRRTSCSS
jgi:hypothetical protein